MIILSIAGLMKKTLYKMSQYFPKPYEPFGGNINVKVDLSNYATKDDITNITHVDTSSFALKTNVANLKAEVDKLDIDELKRLSNNLTNLKTKVDKLDFDKLAPVPADLSKLSNLVNNEVVKKTEYDAKIKSISDKIADISNLATKSNLNTKINEVKNEIPSITGLATTSALAAVKNKIPSISNLVKTIDYYTKVTEIEKKLNDHNHDKYITTTEFKKLATDAANARIVQANLVKTTDFDNKLPDLNRKIVSNKTKDISLAKELSYFRGENHFDEDGNQNYHIFQPISKYLKVVNVNNSNYILSWKSRGLNNIKIESINTNNYSLNPQIDHYDMSKITIQFEGSFLNGFPSTILHGNIVNIYIVYEITSDYKDINYPTLENCLFGSVKLTKNVDIDKYGYSGYGIGFDRETSFSIGNEIGKNVIILMSLSAKIDNRKKDILILGKGPTQALEHTLSTEKMYSINFTNKNSKFCLSLHYNRASSYLFVNDTEIIKFKAKDSEILAYSLCLGNISGQMII